MRQTCSINSWRPARVVAGAAAAICTAFDFLEYLLGERAKGRIEQFAAGNPFLQGLRDRPRLFVNFLEHEVAILAALHGFGRQDRFANGPRAARPRRVQNLDRLAANLGDIAFFQEHEARVTGRSAATSDATKFSPMPSPMTTGQPSRATTTHSGSASLTTAKA